VYVCKHIFDKFQVDMRYKSISSTTVSLAVVFGGIVISDVSISM